eukprot:Lithocolla_globosa_v1_NODE_646_length_3525_cov_40.886455.p5 type:complete len:100 gc:universal NODE_646_length_3525_cov_40.886455:1040-1339(+)
MSPINRLNFHDLSGDHFVSFFVEGKHCLRIFYEHFCFAALEFCLIAANGLENNITAVGRRPTVVGPRILGHYFVPLQKRCIFLAVTETGAANTNVLEKP